MLANRLLIAAAALLLPLVLASAAEAKVRRHVPPAHVSAATYHVAKPRPVRLRASRPHAAHYAAARRALSTGS